MKKFILLILFILLNSTAVNAQLLKNYDSKNELYKSFQSESWNENENLRKKKEEELLKKYSKYITAKSRPLIGKTSSEGMEYSPESGIYKINHCNVEGGCVEIFYKKQNNEESRMIERGIAEFTPFKDIFKESKSLNYLNDIKIVEYSIKFSHGDNNLGGYCTVIGQCGTAFSNYESWKEFRLVDIQKDNAIFVIHTYSMKEKKFQKGFILIGFNGGIISLQHVPNFSPDGRFIIDVGLADIDNQAIKSSKSVSAIVILEANNQGKYEQSNQYKISNKNPYNLYEIGLNFAAQNPDCGKSPHFHSWKNNIEARLSDLPAKIANNGYRAILSFDEKTRSWSCKKTIENFPEKQFSLIDFYNSEI